MGGAKLEAYTLFEAMSEEQLKTAETEATVQAEEGAEEISEGDLGGVTGGVRQDNAPSQPLFI